MQRDKWGMKGRKEGGKERKMVSLGPGSSGSHGSCLCQRSLPAVHLKREGHLLADFSLGKVCSVSVSLSLSLPLASGL